MIALNIDYLDFNASLMDEAFPKFDFARGFETESFIFSDKCRDSVFEYHYHVYEKGTGEFLGLFMACNHEKEGKALTDKQKRIAKFRFADALFYKTFDFNNIHNKLCDEIGMMSKGVSQVDICFDTDEAVFFTGWIFDRKTKKLRASKERGGLTGLDFMLAAKYDLLKRDRRFNRSKVRMIDNITKTQLKEVLSDNCIEFIGRTSNVETQTMEIGAKKSRCMARLYNKTLEMEVKGEKTFITEMWKNSGYSGENPVYRFEISLKRLAEDKSYFYTEDGEYIQPTLNDFFNPEFRRGLFDGVISDKFVFAGDIAWRKEYVWSTCIDKKTEVSYNCGYENTKTVDIYDDLQHNNYTTWACKYLLSLTSRRELKKCLEIADVEAIERTAKIFVDLHEDYTPRFPRARYTGAASLIAAHRNIEVAKEVLPWGLRVKYRKVRVNMRRREAERWDNRIDSLALTNF